jgi:hypothetical protein
MANATAETNEQIFARVDAEHGGRAEAFESPEGELLIIAPPQNATLVYQGFFDASRKAMVSGDVSQHDLNVTFILDCTVHPERPAAKAILKKYPALALAASREAEQMLGGSIKKLGKAQKKPNKTT